MKLQLDYLLAVLIAIHFPVSVSAADEEQETVIETEVESNIQSNNDEQDEYTFDSDTDLSADPDEDTLSADNQHKNFNIGIDRLWLEYSAMTDDDISVNQIGYGHIGFGLDWLLNNSWEIKLSGRADGYLQRAEDDADAAEWTKTEFDYEESYIRYRGASSRVTVGAQKVIWGRVDEIPPSDRLSTHDMTRFILDPLSERRRASAAIRAEYYAGDSKLDILILPIFRESELPEQESIWYPINLQRGKILGIETPQELIPILSMARIEEKVLDSNKGGGGIRFSRSGSGYEYAFTMQHGRQTVPVFSYDQLTNTFTTLYPRFNAIGFDIGLEYSGITWRFEMSAQDGVTVTNAVLTNQEVKSAEWVAGAEFYPGDRDSRINIQLAGKHLIDTTDEVLNEKDIYLINGLAEIPFDADRWMAKLRFSFGINQNDNYLSPELAFRGWEPHEFYLRGHYFHGDPNTLGGYHQDNSLVSLGWRAEF